MTIQSGAEEKQVMKDPDLAEKWRGQVVKYGQVFSWWEESSTGNSRVDLEWDWFPATFLEGYAQELVNSKNSSDLATWI